MKNDMGVSNEHEKLVIRIIKEIKINILKEDAFVIYSDCSLLSNSEVPPIIEGYRPDVYVNRFSSETEIIGEAKTYKDLEKERSLKQIGVFIKYLCNKGGGVFVLAVPWQKIKTAENIIRVILKKNSCNNINCLVVDDVSGYLIHAKNYK